MLHAIRKLLKKGKDNSQDPLPVVETATTTPPPAHTTSDTTSAATELEVVAEAVEVTLPADEPTLVQSEPISEVPAPPPLYQPPRELDLYEPSVKEAEFGQWLEDRIIGQPKALKALVAAYRAYLNPVRNPNKPICNLIFLGPSRTGKTLCAQRLAEYLHGSRDAYIKVDGGDYIDNANLTKLFGASAQWVGYQKPNEKIPDNVMDTSALLSEHNLIASRKGSPSDVTVVLIDEIEKGCAEFFQFFLSIFDVASATMGNNKKVDYSNCIFIMTSNLGMDRVEKEMAAPIGIGASQPEILTETRIASLVEKCMKEHFLPEFRNRIDMSVVFSHLTNESIRKIVDVEISDFEKQLYTSLAERTFDLQIGTCAREFILSEALKSKGNVANLKRVLEAHVRGPLGTGLINDVIQAGHTVSAIYKGGDRLSFFLSGSASAPEVTAQEQPPKQLLEAKELWTQARKDHDANLIDLAISNLRKAIEVLEPLAGSQDLTLALLYNRLGLYYSKKPDRPQEVAAYTKALEYRHRVPSTAIENAVLDAATIYSNLGVTYAWMHQREKAKETYEQGLEYLKKLSQSSNNCGNLAYFLSRYSQFDSDKSEDLFRWALQVNTKNKEGI